MITLTEKVIRQCISEGITEKMVIARRICELDPKVSLESARSRVRSMLGCMGRPLRQKQTQLYSLYQQACQKEDDQYAQASKKTLTPSPVYIITSALNGTPVYLPFWENLLRYAEFLHAQIHVVALRYKNPTSVFTDVKEDVWCNEVLPYLDAARHELFPNLHLLSDIKISPTATTPLTGLNGLSGGESCIFGHSRVQMLSMPHPKFGRPKIMMTTGACTQPNYTDSKAGKKGGFHHTYGFVIARETDFHYVKATSAGSFIDYRLQVDASGVHPAPPVEALVLGDIHQAKLTPVSLNRIYRRIASTRTPMVVMHDVFDGESINPHEEKNPLLRLRKSQSGHSSLQRELQGCLDFVGRITRLCPRVVLVPSNHDFFLDRYICSMDWRKDLENAVEYARLLPMAMREEGVFAHLAREAGAECPHIDQSVKVCGIELNIHGDRGSNGTRGSSVQFKNMSFKVIKGHDHTPSCMDGCNSVGAQELDHGYNQGISSWAVADVIINADGKSQHLFCWDPTGVCSADPYLN